MRRADFLRTNARWLGAGMLLSFLSSFGQTFFIALFAGEIRDAFDLSHGAWGGIYTLGTTASAVAMVWLGALTDIYRSRALGVIVLVGLALACVFMAINPWAVLLPLVIFALRLTGQGMISHISSVSMARWFVAGRGRALAIAGLGFALGEATLPIVFVSLKLVVDWRWLWVVAAAIALAGIPLLRWLLVTERTPQSMADSDSTLGMDNQHWMRAQVLRHPLFWMMIPALLGPPAFSTSFFFQQVHYAEIKGWEHLALVAMFPVYTAVAVGTMIASGWALDRFGTSRVLPWFQLPMVLAFTIFAFAPTPATALPGLMLLGMTTGANSTLPMAFWAVFYGTRFLGSIKAMAAAVMVLGSAIGPGLTGLLIDAGVAIETQYLWIAAYFCLSSFLMTLGVVRWRRALPEGVI